MRQYLIALVVLGLAACDSGAEAPEATSRADAQAEAAAQEMASKVELSGDHLTVGSESFYFNAGRSEVETALARALGGEGESSEMAECGAGPMVGTTYPGGLKVNFQEGRLVGWFLRDGAENIALEGGQGIGTARDAIEGLEMVEGSTLGEEFAIDGTDVAGFLGEDGTVTELYAGTQCFFR